MQCTAPPLCCMLPRLHGQDGGWLGSHLTLQRFNLPEARPKPGSIVVRMEWTNAMRGPLVKERRPLTQHRWLPFSFAPGADNLHDRCSTRQSTQDGSADLLLGEESKSRANEKGAATR